MRDYTVHTQPQAGNGHSQPLSTGTPNAAAGTRRLRQPECGRSRALLGGDVPEPAHSALRNALRTIRSWPAPPNWSCADWAEERAQVASWACYQAIEEYDPNRSSLSLEEFMRSRVLARVLTAYRREWSFSTRCLPLPASEDGESVCAEDFTRCCQPPLTTGPETGPASASTEIRELLLFLEATRRWVLVQIFWHGFTESELARRQRAVSKRKQGAIQRLRDWLFR